MSKPLSEADNQLLRAWRRGELDEATTREVETRLFLEPELLEAARLDQQIEAGLRDSAVTPPALRSPARRNALRQALPLALAAGVGALAVLPLITQRGEPGATHGNVEWVSVDIRRGSEQPLLVAPRKTTGLVAIELPAPSQDGQFKVQVRRSDSEQVLVEVDHLSPSDGVLSLAFNRDALPAGEYTLTIHDGEPSSPPATSLRFRYQP